MDKKTLVAMLLMFLLFMIFQQFVWKPQPIEEPEASEALPAHQDLPAADSLASKSASALADSLAAPGLEASLITLANKHVRVDLSSRGGLITQVELVDFKMEDGSAVNLVPDQGSMGALEIYHSATMDDLKDLVFYHRVSSQPERVEFWLGDEVAPSVYRSYTLDDKYGINMQVKLQKLGTIKGLSYDFSSGIADSEVFTKYKAQDYRFIYSANNELKKIKMPNLKKSSISQRTDSFRWAALRSKYFAIIFKENEPYLSNELRAHLNPETGNPAMKLSSRTSDGKLSWEQDNMLYVGPADYDILVQYGGQMENVAERGPGWLRWMANLIAEILKFIQSYIHNYGFVIIIFSMIMAIILTSIQQPLTRKGMEANLKMQAIQPQMEEIRKRYPNDTNAQRVEMAKLQKEHGINVFGGCIMWVPLLINMPILISLYNVLRYTLDMRNASFILWWQDLSLPDKYYVLPILMALIMVVQTRFIKPPTPPADKMTEQQKQAQQMGKTMNYVMPVMMFFIFRSLPAGLVLYYTVYSIFSALQQYRMQKKMKTRI